VRFPGILPGYQRAPRLGFRRHAESRPGAPRSDSDEGEAPGRQGGAAPRADYLDRRGKMEKQAGGNSHQAEPSAFQAVELLLCLRVFVFLHVPDGRLSEIPTVFLELFGGGILFARPSGEVHINQI